MLKILSNEYDMQIHVLYSSFMFLIYIYYLMNKIIVVNCMKDNVSLCAVQCSLTNLFL